MKSIYDGIFTSEEEIINVNEDLPSGTYMLMIMINNQPAMRKINITR